MYSIHIVILLLPPYCRKNFCTASVACDTCATSTCATSTSSVRGQGACRCPRLCSDWRRVEPASSGQRANHPSSSTSFCTAYLPPGQTFHPYIYFCICICIFICVLLYLYFRLNYIHLCFIWWHCKRKASKQFDPKSISDKLNISPNICFEVKMTLW